MQHMVLSLSMRVPGGLSVHSLSENWKEKIIPGTGIDSDACLPLSNLIATPTEPSVLLNV